MDAQYKYDAFGRRIEKNVNGQITNYLYDGMNIVTDFNGSWYTLKSKYVHSLAIDDPLSVEQGSNIYYYHKDGLGNVTELTDSTGNVVKTYDYKGFGEIHTQTGTVVQPFAFTSREYDLESGLYFYRGRYYDPKAGRFINRDPIGFAGGDVNLFRYVQNNPINFRDPWGLWNEDVHSGIGRSDYGTYIWASQSGFTNAEATIIAMANNATDAYLAQLPIRGVPGRHLNTAIGRVDTRDLFANLDLQLAIKLYKEGDKCGALKTLGRGSHSVQDKIAHGTWPLRWGPHPDWIDDASQRPIELKATEIATKEYFGLFLRGINQ